MFRAAFIVIFIKTNLTTKEESDMVHPLWIERHTSAAEAPCMLNICLPIIPDYARSTELPIIPETMPAY